MVLYNVMPRANGKGWKIESNGRKTGTFATKAEAKDEAYERAGPGDVVVESGRNGQFQSRNPL